MRRILAQVALAALIVSCADKPTAPTRQNSTTTADPTSASGPAASSSPHMVLCANPSGSVFVREQCKSNEDTLDPNALGLVGPQGPPGTPGVSAYEIVSHKESVAAGATASVKAVCPTGKKVLGGGFNVETPTDVKVFASEPSDGAGNVNDHQWTVTVQNSGTAARQTTATAICAMVQ
jgi:hypothetical protein